MTRKEYGKSDGGCVQVGKNRKKMEMEAQETTRRQMEEMTEMKRRQDGYD